MRVGRSVLQVIESCCVDLHASRRRAVVAAVGAVLSCGRVVAASVGRAVATRTSDKHGIKRIDRLLGNVKLQRELREVYARHVAHVVGPLRHPVVLVDWSQVGRDKCVIKAVLALRGRGVPLYAECHRLAVQGRASVHRTFLSRLRQVLPPQCTPVVVTDAGFKHPWTKAVRALGWHFVTRVRGATCFRADAQSPWCKAKQFVVRPPARLLDMPDAELGLHDPVATRLVLSDGRSRRARKVPTERGRRIRARRAVRAAHESWLLATSLLSDAADIAATYALRMQIEQSLRDDKTLAAGWGLSQVGTQTCSRLDVQLLLLALATTAAMLAGIAAEQANLARHYQANTLRNRRVLSLVALGRRVIATAHLLASELLAAQHWLRLQVPQISWLYTRLDHA